MLSFSLPRPPLRGRCGVRWQVQQLNSALPVSLLALNPSELTSIDPRIDRNLRLNVNKRLLW